MGFSPNTTYHNGFPSTHSVPSTLYSVRSVEAKDFPFEHQAPGTRRLCIFALVCSWLCGFGVLGFGCWLAYEYEKGTDYYWTLPHLVAELMPLAINLFVTLLTQSTGYIHTVSLRWSLQREGRLTFNSNLRLFSCSRKSGPNRWWSNAFLLLCITLAYASSSLSFAHKTHSTDFSSVFELGDDDIFICYPAVIFLGLCISGFNSISTWALLSTRIPSWSSSPLDTAYAAMRSGSIQHQNYRCMLSVHDRKKDNQPVYPRMRQRGAWRADREVAWILVILWMLVILCFLVAGIIHHLIGELNPSLDHSWGSWSVPWAATTQIFQFSPMTNDTLASTIAIIFLFGLMQSPLTFGIHCAELQVNLSRDEAFWRKASSPQGCRLEAYDSIKAAFTSWQSVGLFAFKSVLHWLFGLSVQVVDNQLWMAPVQMIYLACLAGLCALYITYISARRPQGSQPAAYGHLQTLVDLIDEWHAVLYWGHKEDYHQVCHAGTSGSPLSRVKNAPYC